MSNPKGLQECRAMQTELLKWIREAGATSVVNGVKAKLQGLTTPEEFSEWAESAMSPGPECLVPIQLAIRAQDPQETGCVIWFFEGAHQALVEFVCTQINQRFTQPHPMLTLIQSWMVAALWRRYISGLIRSWYNIGFDLDPRDQEGWRNMGTSAFSNLPK